MPAFPPYTDLVIDGIEIPDFATRGITVDLEPIDQSKQALRDCNGILRDISLPQFRRRKVVISCSEQEKPAFDGVWPGEIVNVTLIPGLSGDYEETPISMTMMVMGWDVSQKEYEAQGDWSLELEEVGDEPSD